MKKSLLIAAFAGLCLTSCVKEYTCECTSTESGPGMPTTTTTSTFKFKNTKSNAKASCDALSVESSSGGYTSKDECVIK